MLLPYRGTFLGIKTHLIAVSFCVRAESMRFILISCSYYSYSLHYTTPLALPHNSAFHDSSHAYIRPLEFPCSAWSIRRTTIAALLIATKTTEKPSSFLLSADRRMRKPSGTTLVPEGRCMKFDRRIGNRTSTRSPFSIADGFVLRRKSAERFYMPC